MRVNQSISKELNLISKGVDRSSNTSSSRFNSHLIQLNYFIFTYEFIKVLLISKSNFYITTNIYIKLSSFCFSEGVLIKKVIYNFFYNRYSSNLWDCILFIEREGFNKFGSVYNSLE